MKKYIFIFMMISYGISDVPNDLFLQGNQLMLKEKYVDAVQSYESIIALGYENADMRIWLKTQCGYENRQVWIWLKTQCGYGSVDMRIWRI